MRDPAVRVCQAPCPSVADPLPDTQPELPRELRDPAGTEIGPRAMSICL
jgi:hypothetical protein